MRRILLSLLLLMAFAALRTWSTISAVSRLRIRFNLPVAQKLHVRLHPIWLLMQAVNRVGVGIKTPSTTCPSQVLKAHFTVPSWLRCSSTKVSGRITVRSVNAMRKVLGRSLISSKERAFFFHNHSQSCFAR